MQLDTTERTTISVNGERIDTTARTLADLVAARGFAEDQVATARNGEFVARGARVATLLSDGDTVEIVAPRQGG